MLNLTTDTPSETIVNGLDGASIGTDYHKEKALGEETEYNCVITHGNGMKAVPSVVEIRATAIIDQSLYDTFTNNEYRSLLKIFTHKEHLKKNIENIEYDHHSTYKSDEKFKHVVVIRVYVSTSSLWETP